MTVARSQKPREVRTYNYRSSRQVKPEENNTKQKHTHILILSQATFLSPSPWTTVAREAKKEKEREAGKEGNKKAKSFAATLAKAELDRQ